MHAGSDRGSARPLRLLVAIWPALVGWSALLAYGRLAHRWRTAVGDDRQAWELALGVAAWTAALAPLAAVVWIGVHRNARSRIALALNASAFLIYLGILAQM